MADENGKATISADPIKFYYENPAYWNKETFDEMKPMVKAEIERRIGIARGQ